MRTTAFITLAIACLLLSTSADARAIDKRSILGGDGGRGGNGGTGGAGGGANNGGVAAPGGTGGPGAPGGPGGAANLPFSNTVLPAVPAPALPAVPAVPAVVPDASAIFAALPAVPAVPAGLPLLPGSQPADKRSFPVRRRLVARTGAQSIGSEVQSKTADAGKKAGSDGLGATDGIVAKVKGVADKLTSGLPVGKRAVADV
ncbi:MAG: hypothetical protein JSY10_17925 [Paenibacillus sp.]|uniref:Uncharacterized protein n=1 Tax=Thamnidium elegans TaxID=101142 RepID=A0A8H7SEX1_9FUNG|nr:hypothetical protein INT48_003293 [Thamnidium elegans]MBM6385838.1 hypothetical protein [Paenibacillus sp.]